MSAATDDTAPATSPASRPSSPLTGKLGRYTIERELARGGMGVVYLAFDPELERRVALKLLASDDDESRARLLREARAMARLAHTNVVTVFDVGTIDGRDFVAMELMEGGTLLDWLRSKPRRPREIVAAFLAAGRGLAAAHAAGLVHRDFKPSNVLRARDGRFAVTDFGLARDNSETTLPPKFRSDVHVVPRVPTALDDVTATGSILGTPQYMAPEQWENFNVTPATDQFAFCVSMWEAFAGRRPFDGKSAETLRDAMADAARSLDGSAIPRRVRGIIARGLAAEPGERWPSMDRLLTALESGERRRRRIFAATSGIAFTSVVAVVAGQWSARSAEACGGLDTELTPDKVWSTARAAQLPEMRPVVDDDLSAWTALHDQACADPAKHALVLRCLDGTLARLDAIADVTARSRIPEVQDQFLDLLVSPSVCAQPQPPRLAASWSAAARDALYQLMLPDGADDRKAPKEEPTDSCARSIAAFDRAVRTHDPIAEESAFDDALELAGACDDRLRIDIMIGHVLLGDGDDREEKDEARTRLAVDRVPQPDLYAELDLIASRRAAFHDKYDLAIDMATMGVQRARSRHRERLVDFLLDAELEARVRRGTGPDLTYVSEHLPSLVARSRDRQAEVLVVLASELAWRQGDVATAHKHIDSVEHHDVRPRIAGKLVDGVVVDAAGQPVAGATVLYGDRLAFDGTGFLPYTEWPGFVTTDAKGGFAVPMTEGMAVVAIHGSERSTARHFDGATVRLRLLPTRRISGRVEGWTLARRPIVGAFTTTAQDVMFAAPTLPDGTFTIDGVPDVGVHVQAVVGLAEQGTTVTVVDQRGNVDGVVVKTPLLDRHVRVDLASATSAAPSGGYVWIVPDQATLPQTTGDVWNLDAYARDFTSWDRDRLGTDFEHLPHVPLIACAAGAFFGGDDGGRPGETRWMSAGTFRVACEKLDVDHDRVVLKVRPTDR